MTPGEQVVEALAAASAALARRDAAAARDALDGAVRATEAARAAGLRLTAEELASATRLYAACMEEAAETRRRLEGAQADLGTARRASAAYGVR